ncbi:undecaprenyl-diphosphate phosphatase [Providencia rettgeri]|uniref:undecaprenyl-diphosphate phosphatase n=1 Tax=Providencia TaxID=586 RepID=UPI00109D0AAF|nr:MULTISPECIES: undecaprenyl-diphosphate phosphatase [unclassified Providencia]MBQ0530529.1 undecaprenyl-diphosphate phosphatase [Providencia rettgeri]THB28004.1 undecaprenyl-diphosphate phosphatase [Providencia sp. MGF014]WOB85089.1 undecaprenyl-diphosphate phosphatase [Providencia sp. PROV040]
MLEQLNLDLFNLINATPETASGTIAVANVIAKRLILLFPLFTVACWFWGVQPNMTRQRAFACKAAIAIVIGLTISWLVGYFAPHDRPFVMGIGTNFSEHEATPSFPSNHGTIVFTFAFAFLFWLRTWVGLVMMIPAVVIAWSRIYLGVHWPLDMAGAFILAIVACGLAQILWSVGAYKIQLPITRLYSFIFASLIRKGWFQP